MEANKLTESIIGAAIEVHRNVGSGLLEAAYEKCLCHEFDLRGLSFEQQVTLPVTYKGVEVQSAYRMDILVEDTVVFELKAVDTLLPVHEAQLLTYMCFSDKHLGLLINFRSKLLKDGIKRLIL